MFNFSIFIVGRLNYKYHRLVASSDRPGELPQVEKCVVDDDEEDEEEVRHVSLFSWTLFSILCYSLMEFRQLLEDLR